MSEEGKCGAFRYEPTKRKPEFSQTSGIAKVEEEELRIS